MTARDVAAHDVAIVGMACCLPGARDVRSFWGNVASGRSALSPMPPGRWPRAAGPPPSTPGGFVPEPVHVDVLRHRLTPNVVRSGDPDQFLVLELAAAALDDAGISREDPVRDRTDLIVGHGVYGSAKMGELWYRANGTGAVGEMAARGLVTAAGVDPAALPSAIAEMLPPDDVDGLASVITNLVASRAANRLDLGGAAYVVDAACASSLVALEQAVDRLRSGRSDLALVGGINFTHAPHFWYLFSRIGALSPSGAIRPFDAAGDGLVIGEGAGLVVVKRLEDARAAGDRIVAVVKGVASASDGAAKGVLAPSVDGQVRAVRRAYDDADVDPDTVTLVEGHGTATVRGDATELETLARIWGSPGPTGPTRVLGSVKSMIGHTMPAAGVASLIKTSLALAGRVLPPSLGCEHPHAGLDDTDFFVPHRARPWAASPAGPPRRAGVSAFGFGGINAHVVLEEAPAAARVARHASGPARPATSSARTADVGVRPPTELVVCTDAERSAVPRRLDELADAIDAGALTGDVAEAAAAAADPRAPHGAAVVVPGGGAAAAALRAAARRLRAGTDGGDGTGGDSRGGRGGVGFQRDVGHRGDVGDLSSVGELHVRRPGPAPGRLAVLFPPVLPGLSAALLDRLVEQCVHFPAAREVLDIVEAKDGHPDDPSPVSWLMDPPPHLPAQRRQQLRARFDHAATGFLDPDDPDAVHPTARNLALLGQLTASCASWAVLQSLGVRADVLCGFSVGEVAALVAAGVTSMAAATSQGWVGLRGIVPDARSGALLSVPSSPDAPGALAGVLLDEPEVDVAFTLLPDLTLVGGPRGALARVAERLASQGVRATPIAAPPVHTSFYADHASEGRAAMAGIVTRAVEEPVIVAADRAAPLPRDPRAVERAVAENFFRPVHVWQTLQRLQDDGVDTFVQAGPGALPGLIHRVLEGVTVASSLEPDVHPATSLQRLAARLFAQGRHIDPRALFDGRGRRRVSTAPTTPGVPAAPGTPAGPVAPDAPGQRPPRGAVALRLSASPWADADPGPPTMPFLGDVQLFDPQRHLQTVVTLDHDRDLYLDDHAIFSGLGAVKPHARMPIAPLTMLLELLAQPSAALAPGRGLVAFSDVRATQPVGPDGHDVAVHVDARVVATLGDEVVVEAVAEVDGRETTRARVHFAPRYRRTLESGMPPLVDPSALPVGARELYEQRYLFHGPRFRCVTDAGARDATGNDAGIVVLPRDDLFTGLRTPQLLTDPVTLDGVGQAASLYFFGREALMFPVGIDRLEFHRPSPPVGAFLTVRSRWHRPDPRVPVVAARIEVVDGAGDVWLRAEGWKDRLWELPETVGRALRDPLRHTVARVETVDGRVTAIVDRARLRSMPADWAARAFLSTEEERMAGPHAPGGAAGRRVLAARIAVKDAARVWLARREQASVLRHPAELTVGTPAGDGGAASVVVDGSPVTIPHLWLRRDGEHWVAVADARPEGVARPRAAPARQEEPST